MNHLALEWQALHGDKQSADDKNPLIADLTEGLNMEPRAYQSRITSKTIQMFEGTYVNRFGETERPAGSVMIESPTGSGKTVMGLTIARRLQRDHGYRIGWVAMRRNLLAQAAAENEARGFNVDLQMISMFDKDPPPVDMLIVDEAQHDAAMSMANLHCALRPVKILGMTATPYRTDRIKLCFDKVIKDAGIHALIQDGYLSRYHHYTIPAYTPQKVAKFYLADRKKWGKSLIFFHKMEQCLACLNVLADAGVRVDLVTAKTNREVQLANFVEGKTDVLINMSILTEGFDCPSLQTVFCRPSGKSCTVQMAGRVFRKHPDHAFKNVVQCSKTPHPMVKTAMADEQYVWSDDTWRTLKLNARINTISQNALRIIARSEVKLPKCVAAHRGRTQPWHERLHD